MMTAWRIARPATAFSVSPAKGRRRPRQTDRKHLGFIRALPCCVCGSRREVEAAHVRMTDALVGKRETGMGEKPDDAWTVPLCRAHHRDGPQAQHAIGEEAFWHLHRIDPLRLCLALWCASGDEDRAEAIVNETRTRAIAPQGGNHD